MSMRRLARLLSARWWALSLVAVAGLAAAMAIAGYANSKIEPRFSAETSVVLLTGDEESEEVFDSRLATALVRARQVNATFLANESGSSIALDKDSGELLFVAVSTSATEAQTVAEGLREAYASAAPVSFVDQMEQALEATAAEVELLEEQIAALEPQPPVEDDAATIARRGFLESQIAALEAEPFAPAAQALDAALVELLVEEGKAVKAADGVVFAGSAYAQMEERVIAHIREHDKVTVAEVRDLFGTSRKYALALLGHMDDLHITRRVGDERVLLQG